MFHDHLPCFPCCFAHEYIWHRRAGACCRYFCKQYTYGEHYTHKYITHRVAQHDRISSREHAWLKSWKAQDCTRLCHRNNCHPRVMSRSLPHLALTTSTSSLSPISSTSLIFPTAFPLQTSPIILDPYIPCDDGRVADQHESHLSQVMSPTSSRPKRSSLKTSSPEELSLTGILGQIRIKCSKDS